MVHMRDIPALFQHQGNLSLILTLTLYLDQFLGAGQNFEKESPKELDERISSVIDSTMEYMFVPRNLENCYGQVRYRLSRMYPSILSL